MARPTKLNKKLQTQIVKLLKTGVTVRDMCTHIGIAESTYYDWMARGEAGDEAFSEFSETVSRALGDAKVVAIGTLRSAMSPYTQKATSTETFTETRIGRDGKPYDYVRKTERETVTLFQGDWRAAVDYLRRRFPEEWGDKSQVDIKISAELIVKTINALEAAGIDANEFFQKAIARAEQQKNGGG